LKVVTSVLGLGQKAVENIVRVVPRGVKQVLVRIIHKFAQSAEGAGEITVPFGFLNN